MQKRNEKDSILEVIILTAEFKSIVNYNDNYNEECFSDIIWKKLYMITRISNEWLKELPNETWTKKNFFKFRDRSRSGNIFEQLSDTIMIYSRIRLE